MPIRSIAQQAGVLSPIDLDLLSRVFSLAVAVTDTEHERINRARVVISLFRSGITDETALISLVSQRDWRKKFRELVRQYR